MSEVLVARGLSRSFGSIQAVHDVSFEVHAGEVVGLLGPNGAGKTTILRMIAGVVAPDAGQILITSTDGQMVTTQVDTRFLQNDSL